MGVKSEFDLFAVQAKQTTNDVMTMILRWQSHQPKLNVKPTLKQRRNFKLCRRCFHFWMLMLKRRQNNVDITLSTLSTYFQLNFDVVCPLGGTALQCHDHDTTSLVLKLIRKLSLLPPLSMTIGVPLLPVNTFLVFQPLNLVHAFFHRH